MARRTSTPFFVLGAFFLLATVPEAKACPEGCFCMDTFVTCSDFRNLDMNLLPLETDTLVLSRGEMDEIPQGFLTKATNLRMLEISSVNAKVIKSKAFAGLSNLDLFAITNSAFDIVEPDSFSGLADISKFHISDCRFGRVGKHAFSNINNVVDLRVWSSSFDAISDEAFYKLTDTISFQLYQNNITSLGKELFLGASGIDDITIYKNVIERLSEECFDDINEATSRLVLRGNIFICTCDIVWILGSPVFKDYLTSNECIFPDRPQDEMRTFRIADLTRKDLCPSLEESTESIEESTMDFPAVTDEEFTSTSVIMSSTAKLLLSSTLLVSTTLDTTHMQDSSLSTSSEEMTSLKSSTTLFNIDSSPESTLKPNHSEDTSRPIPDSSSAENSTSSQEDTEDVSYEVQTEIPNSVHPDTDITRGPVKGFTKNQQAVDTRDADTAYEGRTEASVSVGGDNDAQPEGSSSDDKTNDANNASFTSHGNYVLAILLVCSCKLLRNIL